MEKRGLIIGIVIVLVLIAVIVNYSLKDDSEELIEEINDVLSVLEPDETEADTGTEIETGGETVPTEIVPYKGVFAADANNLIDDNPDLIIIDASTKYNLGHIPNSINYPVNDGTLESELGSLDKQAKYLVYSSSDPEGKRAAQLMVDARFQEIYFLRGSYGLWIQSGYDYEKSYLTGNVIFKGWF